MKAKHTVAVIVFVAAVATFIGLTGTNTFALPNIPLVMQEQVKQDPQSIQTISQTDRNSASDSNEQEKETEDEDSDEVDPQQASLARITVERAKSIAVRHVSAQLSDVRQVEQENEGSKLIYSVEISKDAKVLTVEVDAVTGSVITVEQDDDDANEVKAQERETDEDTEDQDEVDPQQASQAQLTAEQAKEIAVKHVGAQLSDVREVELESENGHLVYSVEIAKPGKLFEVEVDAIKGTVMIIEQDDDSNGNEETEKNEDATEQVNSQQTNKSTITAEEAKEIAVKHVSAQLSDVREVELESEGGKLIYSVEIVKDGKLVEVEIDATNGNVIAVEHGDDD